jgi:hypothetical protein
MERENLSRESEKFLTLAFRWMFSSLECLINRFSTLYCVDDDDDGADDSNLHSVVIANSRWSSNFQTLFIRFQNLTFLLTFIFHSSIVYRMDQLWCLVVRHRIVLWIFRLMDATIWLFHNRNSTQLISMKSKYKKWRK